MKWYGNTIFCSVYFSEILHKSLVVIFKKKKKKEKDDATLTNVKFKWWNDINKYTFSPLRVIWGCLVEISQVFHKKKNHTPPKQTNKQKNQLKHLTFVKSSQELSIQLICDILKLFLKISIRIESTSKTWLSKGQGAQTQNFVDAII